MTAAIEVRCEQYLATLGGDVAHEVDHIRRVVANARHLGISEGARLDVLIPAAWLHDCVAVPKTSPDRARASQFAADDAVRMRGSWGYPADLLPAIAHAIHA